MKKINYYLGTLALAAMTLASCSSDEPMKGQEPEKVLTDQTQYLAVSICNPVSMGRADATFEDGAKSESAVNELVFVFYDGSGNATATMKTFSGTSLNSGWEDKYQNGNVTRIWTSVVPVEMTQGQEVPTYVMCFVNPINKTGLSTMTLKEVENTVRTRISHNGFFTMCNSAYYGNNPISGQQNVRMMATPIKFGLYKTEKEANDALGAPAAEGEAPNILDIYVERQAAKIGLTLDPTKIETYDVNVMGANETSTPGTIKFTPEYWRPNAIDERTYVCKAFATGDAGTTLDPTTPATYDAMNAAFNNTGMEMGLTTTNPWNDPDKFRSYWACSPSYFTNSYPTVSDDITDNADWETNYPYDLHYFTYTEIKDGIEEDEDTDIAPAEPGIEWKNGFSVTAGNQTTPASGYFYSRETTAAITTINSTTLNNKPVNNKAVVASAVIVGRYHLNNGTTDSDFYLYGKKDGKDNYYGDITLLKTAMINNQSVIFTDIKGEHTATNTDLFEVVHPAKEVREGERVPGRLVTLQLKAAGTTPAVYYYTGEVFKAVETAEDLAAANKLLWKSVSTASMFKGGLAFFSIPIRHLGYGLNPDPNKPVTEDGANANIYNWQNVRRGDFGIVRNHVYTLNVNKISGLGVGLRDEDQPIVPPMDPDNYYIAARLNILAWRVVTPQGVDL